MRSRGAFGPSLLAVALIGMFLVVSLRHLDAVPQVYEDEPWQASTAYKLATQGVFGSDLFKGFFGMDQRYYGFMPLHPALLALTFGLTNGPGLQQSREETVLLTALTLVLTFSLGARLFSPTVGALATAVLLLVRWTGLTYVQLSGIPVFDFARIARYDPLVPVIGLTSLHVYLSAKKPWSVAAAGALAGLAGLAHVYGLFWVLALVLLAAWNRQQSAIPWLALGAVLPWLPYAAYVVSDLPDWRGQTAIYASRFELLDPRWYLSNLLDEYHRYGPGLGSPGPAWLLRPGIWFLAIALPLSLVGLFRRALRGNRAARAIVVPALLFPVLFALLITLKLVNYTLIELPLFAIAIGWGLVSLWQVRQWLRPILSAAAALVVIEGATALVRLDTTTAAPYPAFAAELREYLPPGARVLGLHTYWFGLQDYDYRSWLVPLNRADLGEPLDQALSDVDPDIVLLDARIRGYFGQPDVATDRARLDAWLAAHSAQEVGRIDDPTYGSMQIYRVSR